MIEFTIPLNLPLRAVAITETTASPPDSVLAEMAILKRRRSQKSPMAQDSAADLAKKTDGGDGNVKDVERERELEQLRVQQELFRRAAAELKNVTSQYATRAEGMIHEFQVAAVELAEAISAKLIFEEVDANRFPIANLVHEVVSRLDTTVTAVIRLHPADLAQMKSLQAISDTNSERTLEFVPDATLARGDCKAKAGEMTVIYELRRQIDDIRQQLLSTVDGHAEP